MNDALPGEKRAAAAEYALKPGAQRFVQFDFLRIDPRFHTLQTNEKLVARQDFLRTFESQQRNAEALTYSLSGLRADCDVLVWRASERIEALQEFSARLRGSGAGKYLASTHSFLTLAPSGAGLLPGQAKFLFAHLITQSREWHSLARARRQELQTDILHLAAKHAEVKMQLYEAIAMEGHDFVIAFETEQPQAYVELQRAISESPWNAHVQPGSVVFPCIRKDIHDLADALE